MLWSSFFLPFLCLPAAFAKLLIIDDALAGETQSSILYSPPDAWVLGTATNHGRIAPDASQAQNGTWHDATDDTTANHEGTTPIFMTILFQGSGIDIRCIIPNNKNDPSIPPFTGTKSNYSFFVDEDPQNRDFIHEAGTTGPAFLYNTSVFSTTGLSNSPHNLTVLLNGGPQVNGSVLLLFDYALVTSDDGAGDSSSAVVSPPGTTSQTNTVSNQVPAKSSPAGSTATPTSSAPAQSASTPSSSSSAVPSPAHRSNIGAIIGALVGGLLALALLLLFCFWSRRRRALRQDPPILPLPYSIPHFRSRPSIWRKAGHNPSPNRSIPSGTSSEPRSDPVAWDDVQRLRAEVELLRGQQREMVAMQRRASSPSEPPPRYEKR
ncbi:hypothetical protein DFH06DRAFT_734267 [Mycena polygramma]|nr:hypothetical protein DFH06DRAFT_734267 [Mycena polygramma]